RFHAHSANAGAAQRPPCLPVRAGPGVRGDPAGRVRRAVRLLRRPDPRGSPGVRRRAPGRRRPAQPGSVATSRRGRPRTGDGGRGSLSPLVTPLCGPAAGPAGRGGGAWPRPHGGRGGEGARGAGEVAPGGERPPPPVRPARQGAACRIGTGRTRRTEPRPL